MACECLVCSELLTGAQEVSAAIVAGAVYFVGGFSYIPPYCFDDTLKLARIARATLSLWQKMTAMTARLLCKSLRNDTPFFL